MAELTLEEKQEKVKDFRPIDDVFFEVLSENAKVCEEILQTILEDPHLEVADVIVQSSNKTTYHIEKRILETGQVVDDGLHEIFVDTVVDDGTDIAELMACFTQKMVENPKFPEFSREVHRLKTTEGGTSAVCDVMKKYEKFY